jgi:hypothetical protein
MGFLSPKVPQPDPALTALQASQTAEAKRQRIDLLSQQLDEETRLRARRFGTRSLLGGLGSSFATPSTMTQNQTRVGAALLANFGMK